ncbi:RDD family protein [Alkalihalobacillus pseudalcaliphilus]|uniref:RDD family protein n=1 Tax=Alkalihalobacillus pseudalcaliphilus TaxID=79884 RepID=UPI00064DAA47|nr:RDD family protein [Alkalihalobacillus pseudalcaliphilus]KMK75065.1 RDD domain containing protein [Alkalihalobacillus pseudalcaliphilus]
MNQEQVNIKTPEFVSVQFKAAGLGSRSLAFMIDQLLLWVVNIVLALFFFYVFLDWGASLLLANSISWPLAILVLVLFLINSGYFIIYEYVSGGRTLGKKIIGIRVIQENGHSITLLSSFIRNFLRLVDQLPAAYFVGIVLIFLHSKHKRLGDIVGGTIVVHERRTKRTKKKESPLEKEIFQRGLRVEQLKVEPYQLEAIREREWEMLRTYAERFTTVSVRQRDPLTKKLADIILPLVQLKETNLSMTDKENILLLLYVSLQDDWDFDL